MGKQRVFELQAYLFPTATVLLTAFALLCGGRVAAWQIPTGGGGIALLSLLCRSTKARLCSFAIYFGALFAYWIFISLFVYPCGYDLPHCHLAAVRLLKEGFNPVYDATPEKMMLKFGLDANDFLFWHFLQIPKAIYYYNAAAMAASFNKISVMMPILPPLMLMAAIEIWHVLGGIHKAGKVAIALAAIASTSAAVNQANVDFVAGLAALGFACATVRSFRDGRMHRLSLFSFGFWMLVSKAAGAPAFLAMAAIFTAFMLWRHKNAVARRSVTAGIAALAAAAALVCASPLWSSWRDYKCPFYPSVTVDEERFPQINVTEDFLEANADCRSMNRIERFTNAFASERAVAFYRKKILGQSGFRPWCRTWAQSGGEYTKDGWDSPTAPQQRLVFCAFVIAILLMGDAAARMAALSTIVAVNCIPAEMIGYLRYVPYWQSIPLLFACEALWRRTAAFCRAHHLARTAKTLAAAFCIVLAGEKAQPAFVFPLTLAYYIDLHQAFYAMFEANPGMTLYACHPANDKTIHTLNLRLWQRQMPAMKDTVIAPAAANEELARLDEDELQRLYPQSFDYSFRHDAAIDASKYLAKTPGMKLRSSPVYILKQYFIAAPRLLMRLCTR